MNSKTAHQETLFSKQVEQQSYMGMYFKYRMFRTLIVFGLGLLWVIGSFIFGAFGSDDGASSNRKSKSSSFWSKSKSKTKTSSGFQRYMDY